MRTPEGALNELTMETLLQRWCRVQLENRWLKLAGVVALSVIAAVGLMEQVTAAVLLCLPRFHPSSSRRVLKYRRGPGRCQKLWHPHSPRRDASL